MRTRDYSITRMQVCSNAGLSGSSKFGPGSYVRACVCLCVCLILYVLMSCGHVMCYVLMLELCFVMLCLIFDN